MPKLPPPEETRWKPGESGNPNGRPKGSKSLVTILRDIVDSNAVEIFGEGSVPEALRGKKVKEILMLKMVAEGLKGDRNTINDILDRLVGKPVSVQEISGPGGVPLQPPTFIITDDAESAKKEMQEQDADLHADQDQERSEDGTGPGEPGAPEV